MVNIKTYTTLIEYRKVKNLAMQNTSQYIIGLICEAKANDIVRIYGIISLSVN